MTPSLDGRVAIVTGAVNAFGEAIVNALLSAGAAVVATDGDADGLERVRAGAASLGEVRACQADVREDAEVAALVAFAMRELGPLSIMCNNAFVLHTGTVETMTPEGFDELWAANVRSVFLGCRHAIPALRAAGGGAIVTTASASSVIAGRELAAYCATKGAVVSLMRAVAVDHGHEGIRANCVSPGTMEAAVIHTIHPGADYRDEQVTRPPLGRLGRAADVASAVVFLASEQASFITGASLMVDGGTIIV